MFVIKNVGKRKPQRLFLCLLILWQFACGHKEEKTYDMVIRCANIINTNSGKVTEDQSIAILGDSIAVIADYRAAKGWKSAWEVDASGKFVIPGLWDMHIHFGGGDTLIKDNRNLLPLYIANGVTTVRDCAADLSPQVIEWRNQIADGDLLGPNIFTSGPKIEGKNSIWPGDQEIENEEELATALDSLKKIMADFVKITDNALSANLFMKSVIEAHKSGFKVSGHIPFNLKLEDLSDAGLNTVEHMSYMLKAGSSKVEELIENMKSGAMSYDEVQKLLMETYDPDLAMKVYKKLSENGTAVVPTLIGNRIISYLDQEDHKEDAELKYMGQGLINTYQWRVNRANQATEKEITSRKAMYNKLVSLIPVINKSGMDIIAGTDAGFLNSYIYPGFSLHEELQIYVRGGLTPLEALQTSVINGPKFFGLLDQYGSVEVGNKADLLLLNSNPVQDIKATKDIHTLIRAGKEYTRKDLDGLLEKLAEINKNN